MNQSEMMMKNIIERASIFWPRKDLSSKKPSTGKGIGKPTQWFKGNRARVTSSKGMAHSKKKMQVGYD